MSSRAETEQCINLMNYGKNSLYVCSDSNETNEHYFLLFIVLFRLLILNDVKISFVDEALKSVIIGHRF